MTDSIDAPRRAALIIAHPGHELAILGWVEDATPVVFVLTDGAGRQGHSRIGSTTAVLHAAGASPGSIYGRLPESAVYAALLGRETRIFVALAQELADALIDGQFAVVVGEAAEGFQSTHDVFRLVVDAAVERARRVSGAPISSFEFRLFRGQAADAAAPGAHGITVSLDDERWQSKLRVAANYPELMAEYHAAMTGDLSKVLAGFPELASVARASVGELGPAAYKVEHLQLVPPGRVGLSDGGSAKPFYELYGEALSRAARVEEVIRRRDHLEPVAAALANWLDTLGDSRRR